MTYLLNEFGSIEFEFDRFINKLFEFSESTNPGVRNESIEFFKEIYRWEALKIREMVTEYLKPNFAVNYI